GVIAVGADGGNAIVVSAGANGRVNSADVKRAADVVEAAEVVLLQLEVPLEAVSAAVHRARGTVVLNPAPAPAAMLPPDLLDRVDVIVPNQTELATLAGHAGLSPIGGVDPETAVALARGLPVAAAVVTLGAAGAMVVTPADATHVPAPTVTPVDTTAAGDAFCGALADALVGGADLVEATEWAVKVGAAATLRPGAQPSLPTPNEVELLIGN
ncbi:MAG: PfkB family carbohydrate kinase, partial [Gemmatimonadota bacterium]|nr:PfkB family carbohydrate kinase [Gemmatimonadota bacterium]